MTTSRLRRARKAQARHLIKLTADAARTLPRFALNAHEDPTERVLLRTASFFRRSCLAPSGAIS